MKYINKLLFFLILIISSLIAISATNWLTFWMSLEMNLIAFIPLIMTSKDKNSSEAMMIYFLVQSIGSMIMLMIVMINSLIMAPSNLINLMLTSGLMVSLLLKLGAAPFHFWLPELMNKLNWVNCTILMTWQKITPMIIINSIINLNQKMLFMTIILSVIVGAVGGLNQTSLRKIMAFSSINHLGWMLTFMMTQNSWMKYLIIYSIMIISACMFFNHYNIYYLTQLIFYSSSMMEKFTYIIIMMSMGGLPPFMGFLPKWMVIQSVMEYNMFNLLFILVMSSLLTLFYYLRLMSFLLLNYSTTVKWFVNININKQFLFTIISINLLFPLFCNINFY
uniref:NADH-ubiquinone oxidoreductase chain 2 n=1 Tax=Idiostolus sp. TaxID=2931296 RepID=A0A8T9ZYA2_9HEMI|nr:NADH dehydrogenase subunit 2 [Idiostolus sp.]